MALTHNIIIRGMNSIYLQCADVTPSAASDFITYCQCWSEFIHNHHECEEASYFPLIEKAVGSAGMADENVEQHEAFMEGLHEFDRYLCKATPMTFSGATVLQILDSFAAKLQIHLTDEIVWIQSLAQSYPELDLAAIDACHGQYVKTRSTKTRILPFFLTNHDKTYENGIHAWWPTGNALRDLFLRYICTLVHSGAWRYSSCSRGGRPKRLEGIRRSRVERDLEGGNAVEMAPKRPETSVRMQVRTSDGW